MPPGGTLPKLAFFSLPCLHLRGVTIDQCGLKIPSRPCLVKLRFDSVYGMPVVEVPLLPSLYPSVCLLGAFLVTPCMTCRHYKIELSSLFIYLFMLCMATWQVFGCLPV